MKQYILGFVLICAGLAMILFRRNFARNNAKIQKETFGISLAERAVKTNERMLIVLGLIAVVLGALSVLGVIKWVN